MNFEVVSILYAAHSSLALPPQGYMYYVNDGVYGSFNCLVFDHATVEPKLVHDSCEQERFPSSIWGPSCDSMDCIAKEVMLPKVSDSLLTFTQVLASSVHYKIGGKFLRVASLSRKMLFKAFI